MRKLSGVLALGLLVVGGCELPFGGEAPALNVIPAGIEFVGRASIESGTTLQTELRATNTGPDLVQLVSGNCAFNGAFGVRIFAGASGSGQPVWDSRKTSSGLCLASARVIRLAQDQSHVYQIDIPLEEITKTLSRGQYSVILTTRFRDMQSVDVSAGSINIP